MIGYAIMGNGQFTILDRERLVRLEDGIENLTTAVSDFVDTATSDTGFPRCAARDVKLNHLEKTQSTHSSFITWFYRTVAGITLIVIITVLRSYSSSIAELILK